MPERIDTAAPPRTVLRVDASARRQGSATRRLADRLVDALTRGRAGRRIVRDLAGAPPPLIDETWIAANFAAPESRTAAQRAALAESDRLVAELQAADDIVLAVPIYNFSVPAALKAWFDQVARARLTFRYTADGPQGLLRDKRAWLVVASGGTEVGGPVDFATGWLRHALAFLGIEDVRIIAADRLMVDPARLDAAERAIDALAAPGVALSDPGAARRAA